MKTMFNSITIAVLLLVSCSKTEVVNLHPNISGNMAKTDDPRVVAHHYELMPMLSTTDVYVDFHPFTVKLQHKFTGAAAKELIAQTPVVRSLYFYSDEQLLDREGHPFLAIGNSIRSLHGEQVVWKEYLVKFGRGLTPRQYYSVQDLEDAVSTSGGQLEVRETGNVFQGTPYLPQLTPTTIAE